MSQETASLLFIVLMWSNGAMLLLLAFVVILSFFLPWRALDRYFAEPYFSRHETGFFSGTRSYVRTFMLMRLVVNPSSGRARGLEQASLGLPAWFRALSWIVLSLLGVILLGIVVPLVLFSLPFLW